MLGDHGVLVAPREGASMSSRWCAAVVGLAFASSLTLSAQDPKLVEEGKKAYVKYDCKKCHLIGTEGSKTSPLNGVATKMSADDIRKWLVNPDEMTAKLKKKPKVKMKKQPISPAEVDALMAYMLTLK
jgi:cytochrome c